MKLMPQAEEVVSLLWSVLECALKRRVMFWAEGRHVHEVLKVREKKRQAHSAFRSRAPTLSVRWIKSMTFWQRTGHAQSRPFCAGEGRRSWR